VIRRHLTDPRDPRRVTHPWAELVRTTLLLQAQGWSDQDDVKWLGDDPVLALAVSGRRGQRPVRGTGRAAAPARLGATSRGRASAHRGE